MGRAVRRFGNRLVRAGALRHVEEIFLLYLPEVREAMGAAAVRVGKVVAGHRGLVVLRTAIGGTRIVDQLPGDQLPRIC